MAERPRYEPELTRRTEERLLHACRVALDAIERPGRKRDLARVARELRAAIALAEGEHEPAAEPS